jgi:hypothetical protein
VDAPIGVVHVEDDLRVRAAKGQADHVVDLLVAAGAQAAGALDAGVQVDGDGRVRQVGATAARARQSAACPRPSFAPSGRPRCGACAVSGMSACSSSSTSFCDFSARSLSVLTFMPACRAAARRRQRALAGDLHHAGAAVATASRPGL